MLKEQNVINKILTLAFILASFNLIGQQKIEGKYCVEYDLKIHSKCLVLKENNKFEMTFGKHINKQSTLSGEWVFTNNELILNYNEPEYKLKYTLNIFETEAQKDSVQIKFKIKDFNDGPMLGLKIKILPDDLSILSDHKGETSLNFKKSNRILNVFTEYLGYEKCHFSFDLKSNKIIEIYINEFNKNDLKYGDNLKLVYDQNSLYTINDKGKKIKWIKDD